MVRLTRRSVLRSSLGLAAAGTLARPYIANAQAKTAEVWWVQGFVPEEDAAFQKLVADYEKESGNKIDFSIIPFAPMRQKIISAITSGVVPDVIYATPPEVIPLQAWEGRLVDVTDVVETQKPKFLEIALASANCYNNVEKKRSYYGVPFEGAVVPFHIWGSLVEKAGYKISDIPNTWDAFIDFFKPVQKKLQEQGMRHTYATAFVVSTIGNDPTNTFQQFMIAYGGENIVTKDGQFNGKDPQVHEAVVKAVDRLVEPVQGRLHAAELDQLERRGRQQRVPLQAVRDGFRRHAVDRAGDAPETKGRAKGRHHPRPAADQRRQTDEAPIWGQLHDHPQGREERRGRRRILRST